VWQTLVELAAQTVITACVLGACFVLMLVILCLGDEEA
jgi:hypothetical protein